MREREGHTGRQTGREKERERQTGREKERERQTGREKERERQTGREKERERQTGREKERGGGWRGRSGGQWSTVRTLAPPSLSSETLSNRPTSTTTVTARNTVMTRTALEL